MTKRIRALVNGAGEDILTFDAEMDEDDTRAYDAFIEWIENQGFEIISLEVLDA